MNGLYCFFTLFLSVWWAGCSEKPPLSGSIQVPSGDVWANAVYLVQPRTLDEVATSFAGQVLDTAIVQADGRFVFSKMPNAPEPILLVLTVQKKGERFANRLENDDLTTANYFPIVWKNGDHLEVTAIAEQFQRSFTILQPTSENTALLQLRDARHRAFQTFREHSGPDDHDESQLLEKEAALLKFQQASMDFAQQTPHLLPALVAFRWASPENDYERLPEFLFSQCEKWKTAHNDHPWTVQLCQKSNRTQLAVMKGDQFPDVSLPMRSGDTTALRALLGERLTIVDLWASWCGPCRRENREVLVPLWEKHHSRGLQIIGYALDSSKDAWEKAIDKDGAYRWPHASHLQGDDSPLMETLRIRTIPANFILDGQGNVVAKNLHGETLVQLVEEMMGK